MIFEAFLVTAAALFALQAIRARRLIVSALWLSGTSALVSILLYLAGAQLAAVIELSVGAGLVTVLFAFAISISGEDTIDLGSMARPAWLPGPQWLVPRLLGGALALAAVVLLGWLVLPVGRSLQAAVEPAITEMIWQVRGLDILVQIVLIFAGVLGLLGLLAEEKAPLDSPHVDEFVIRRKQELKDMQEQPLEKERV
jgi:NADH:ubiquinone oxidoreductase subunit 6 (subunit J)